MQIDDAVVDVVDATTKLGAIWCSSGEITYYKQSTKTRIIGLRSKDIQQKKN